MHVPPDTFRYSAFISYSHRDVRWAVWLHRALERYRLPRRLRRPSAARADRPDRLRPVFRDRDEFAVSADLARSVREALAASANLIVVCSADSARSRWVDAEVREFVRLGRRGSIHCLIPPDCPPEPSGPIFVPELVEDGREPLAADARRGADGTRAAFLKIVAGLIDVRYDDLRQRDVARRQRRLLLVTTASLIALVGTTALAVLALVSRQEARRERDVARQKSMTAERTVDFVKSLFETSDPSEAQGAKVTALDVLDKGARQIGGSLRDEPNVRADLSATLSEVYINLGFYRRADGLIRRSMGWPVDDPATAFHQRYALGNSQMQQGDLSQAMASLTAALAIAERFRVRAPELVSRALVARAGVLSLLGQYDRADADIDRALRIDRDRSHTADTDADDIARDLEAKGSNDEYHRRYPQARAEYARALAIRLRTQGPTFPRVADDLSELGAIAYYQGDAGAAETFYRRTLRSDEKVLGPGHPDVAATLNNLARVLLERRDFAEARPMLARSIRINLAQRSGTHGDMAFIFANMALVEQGLGDLPASETDFRKALAAAEVHHSRNIAPILTSLADVRCARGDPADGLRLLDRAEPIMRATYPDEPWRAAWVVNTRGACLLRGGRDEMAARLLRASAPALNARWRSDTLYGYAVRRRQRALDLRLDR